MTKDELWAYMIDNPMSAQELADHLGVSKRYANMRIKALQDKGAINRQRLRIVDWYTGVEMGRSGCPTPVYAVSYGADKPKPVRGTMKEASKRWWGKYKAVKNAKRRVNKSVWHGLVNLGGGHGTMDA